MTYSRRNFLTIAGSALGGALIPSLGFSYKLFADGLAPSSNDHFFVMIKTYGAMDCTLGLDPQVHRSGSDQSDIFIEYRPEDIALVKALKFGPAALPLKGFAGDIAVVNGILMATQNNDHNVLNAYMRSGDPKGKLGAFPIELAAHTVSGPLGVIVSEGVEIGQCDVVISSTNEILSSSANGQASAASPLISSQKSQDSFVRAELAYANSQQFEGGIGKVIQELNKDPARSKLGVAVAVAGAFAAGGAKQAHISINASQNGNLDTHSDHEGNHLRTQLDHWDQVAKIFQIFKDTPFKADHFLIQPHLW